MLQAGELRGDATAGRPLRAGVIGAGVFGGFHADKYANAANVALSAVFDPDGDRATRLAEAHGAGVASSIDDLIDRTDVVTVAAPADVHFDIAAQVLQRGRHVYVEKPLALRRTDADRLNALALERGLVLRGGHQERCVVDALGAFADGEAPRRLEFSRCGPASGRCEDVSVVYDLMVHDLDLVARLGFGAPVQVDAAGDAHDVVATLVFANGRSASFTASRRASARARQMTAFYDDGLVSLDFLNRRLRSTRPQGLPRGEDAFRDAPADPLGANVAGFLADVRANGRDGAADEHACVAVGLAEMVEQARVSLARTAMAQAARVAAPRLEQEKLSA